MKDLSVFILDECIAHEGNAFVSDLHKETITEHYHKGVFGYKIDNQDKQHLKELEDQYSHYTAELKNYPGITLTRQTNELKDERPNNDKDAVHEYELTYILNVPQEYARTRFEQYLEPLRTKDIIDDHKMKELDEAIRTQERIATDHPGIINQVLAIKPKDRLHIEVHDSYVTSDDNRIPYFFVGLDDLHDINERYGLARAIATMIAKRNRTNEKPRISIREDIVVIDMFNTDPR